jgi:hypothetical protein
MQILIPVSVGELIDKLTILNLKMIKITDPKKLSQVTHERDELFLIYKKLPMTPPSVMYPLMTTLAVINSKLWEVEDELRIHEQHQAFMNKDDVDHFIDLARSVYVLNDQRFNIKNQINTLSGSDINEVKNYARY